MGFVVRKLNFERYSKTRDDPSTVTIDLHIDGVSSFMFLMVRFKPGSLREISLLLLSGTDEKLRSWMIGHKRKLLLIEC